MSKVLGRGKYPRTKKHREDAAKRASGNTHRLGKPHSSETKAKIGLANTKAEVGYAQLHRRFNTLFPKTGICERCGGTSRDYHNREGEYSMVREAWEELCQPCHRIADHE